MELFQTMNIECAGMSSYSIFAPAFDRGFKMCDRPNPSSIVNLIELSKLSDCMASIAFYIFSNVLFYADLLNVNCSTFIVLSIPQLRSPLLANIIGSNR